MGMILSSPTGRKSKNCRDARRNCFHCKSLTEKCLQRNAVSLEVDIHLSTPSAQEVAVLGHSSPRAKERGKDSQSTEMLPKDQLRVTVKNRQFCNFVRD